MTGVRPGPRYPDEDFLVTTPNDPTASPAAQQATTSAPAFAGAAGMRHRRVGRSGLMASAIGLGCFPFGSFLDEAGSRAVVDAALDVGICYFDTADSYGMGRSESALGAALAGRRDRVVVATKFGNRMGDGINDRGTSRLWITRACEASLRRLRTDYIDLYQLHWPDRDTPLEETLRALDDLVRAGKVRYIGASNCFPWELCEAAWTAERHGLAHFVSTQDHHNLLYREAERQLEPFCTRYGLGRNCYFPLAGGMLADGFERDSPPVPGSRRALSATIGAWQTERNWALQGQLRDFAHARGWTLAQLSLAWLLTRPGMFTVIAGADAPAHVHENVRALQVRLSQDDLDEIDRITLADEDRSQAPVYRTLRPEKMHEYGAMMRARTDVSDGRGA